MDTGEMREELAEASMTRMPGEVVVGRQPPLQDVKGKVSAISDRE